MCEGSMHHPHRMAKKTERLVVQSVPHHDGMKGYFPKGANDAGHARLVCVRGEVKAVIKVVRLEKGVAPSVQKWEGKRNLKVLLRNNSYGDYIVFPDERSTSLHNLRPGVHVDIGVKAPARKSKGMLTVERAMREALALPPDPKEEEAEQPKAPAEEPAAAPAPHKEPEPAAPSARRR
jgi:hypothetical protein